MDTLMSRIFAQEHSEIVGFLDALTDMDQRKIASSFLQTQHISEISGRYTMAARLDVGQTLLTRDSGPVEIIDVGPLQLEGASVMPVVHIEKHRFVNGKTLVLSPLHMVRCDVEHATGIDHQPRYSPEGIPLVKPVYMRAGDLVDGDSVRFDLMRTTEFRQISLQRTAAIYVEGQAIKVNALR